MSSILPFVISTWETGIHILGSSKVFRTWANETHLTRADRMPQKAEKPVNPHWLFSAE